MEATVTAGTGNPFIRFFGRLGDRSERRVVGERATVLYARIVAQARRPAFYRHAGVPDSVDGRFDMIVLHLALVVARLRREPDDGMALAQAIFDTMLDDMDRSLREMGVGDLAVGRRVKAMARAFYGRAAAYDAAIAGGAALGEVLARNLYGTAHPIPAEIDAMAAYVRASAATIDKQAVAEIVDHGPAFGAPPVAS